MSLYVFPLKNNLQASSNSFRIGCRCSSQVSLEGLIECMLARTRILGRPEILCCMELLRSEVTRLVADGNRVQTPLGSFSLMAKGMLESEDARFSPGKGGHRLRLNFRPDRSIERKLSDMARIETIAPEVDDTRPSITDIEPSEPNRSPTAGDFIRITGKHLKFNPVDTEQGVFLVGPSRLRVTYYATVKPSTIVFRIPSDCVP